MVNSTLEYNCNVYLRVISGVNTGSFTADYIMYLKRP
jgi:hypothetical protein